MARFDLTDAEWTIIAPLLPGAEGRKNGRPRPDDRKVINGIFFVLRAPALPGVICRSAMGPTRPCAIGSIVGIWLRKFEVLGEIAAVTATDRLIDYPRSPACGRR